MIDRWAKILNILENAIHALFKSIEIENAKEHQSNIKTNLDSENILAHEEGTDKPTGRYREIQSI